jgi:hypothetical protein
MTSVIVQDDFSPMYVGDTLRPFAPVFAQKQADGTYTAVNIAGATITMKMQGTDSITSGTTKTCNGTWSIDDAANGKAHYAWQTADVNTAGLWALYVTISIGGLPVHGDFKLLQILTAP